MKLKNLVQNHKHKPIAAPSYPAKTTATAGDSQKAFNRQLDNYTIYAGSKG